MEKQKYSELDFGTKSSTPIPTEKIEVEVSTDALVTNYCHAMVMRMITQAGKVYEQIPIQEEELETYLAYLLWKRCEQCGNGCKDYGRLKTLWIPSYWQFVLSMIGRLTKRSYAITVIPVSVGDCPLTFEEAKAISDKLGEYEMVLHMERASMPTGTEGDEDVMSSALIANTVRSMSLTMHPAMSYVVAIANMKLKQETAFRALYRAQYDDLGAIALQMSMPQLT